MEEQIFIEDLVSDQIVRLSNKLNSLEPGTDEYSKVNSELIKLTKEHNDVVKFQAELEEKAASRESDRELKLKQIKGEKIDRWVKNGLTAVSIGTSLAAYVWCCNKSWKFEETGTVCNTPGRKSIGNLLTLFKK